MSKKGNNVAGFYLVPVEAYKTLSELKAKNDQLEKQLSESLKLKTLASTEKIAHLENQVKTLQQELDVCKKKSQKSDDSRAAAVSSEHFSPAADEEQQGGRSEAFSNDAADSSSSLVDSKSDLNDADFRQKLFFLFEKFLKSQQIIQTGTGSLDLTPVVPIPLVNIPEVKPSPENVTDLDVMNKDSITGINSPESVPNNSRLDEEKLINSVRTRYKDKARELLNELKNYPDDIIINEDGTILIEGEKLPNANFYELFPLLFRPIKGHRDKKPLAALLDEIASLGLGHLVLRNYTSGITPKGKNYLKDRTLLRNHLKSNKPWYWLEDSD